MNMKIPSVEELAKNAVHIGHKTGKICPQMLPYISGIQATLHIIDLEKTREKLKQALDFLKKVAQDKGIILFVGTKPVAKKLIRETAEAVDMPYVNEKWIGGTLTNFSVISKSIEELKKMKEEKEKNVWSIYTKKEQLNLSRKLEKLEKLVGGLSNLDRLPDALFIVDLVEEKTALKEARKLGIPVVALVDTNANPTFVKYPIPANDDALKSVQFLLDLVKQAISSVKEKSEEKNEEKREENKEDGKENKKDKDKESK